MAQTKFQPCADNGGSIVAIAGADFSTIGADSRLSSGYSILTRDQKRLFRVTDTTVLATAGCWADELTLTRLVRARAGMYEIKYNSTISTSAAAQMLSTMLYFKRLFPYYISSLLAGLDNEGKGCVFGFDPIGHYERSRYQAGGSAKELLLPLLDNQVGLKNMQNVAETPLIKEKALNILRDVFISAAERDIDTGNNVYIVKL